jgi:hypothetical protein
MSLVPTALHITARSTSTSSVHTGCLLFVFSKKEMQGFLRNQENITKQTIQKVGTGENQNLLLGVSILNSALNDLVFLEKQNVMKPP